MTSQGKIVFLILILLIAGGLWYGLRDKAAEPVAGSDEMTFSVDGVPVTLVNGKSEVESAPGSASKTTTTYFGNEVKGDFNGDSKEDRAFLVTQTTGGSGTFYYVATSLGGNALVLGDRISPQTTEYRSGKIIVNYADRNPGEPMTATPTVGMSRYFIWSNGNLTEVLTLSSDAPLEIEEEVTVTKEETACTSKGGNWSTHYRECTGIDGQSCTAIGGTYDECASACRHNPKAEACILMCVQVCKL
jgi:hypothetical protein